MSSTNFMKDKPVFGFDIGHGSLKVMQLEMTETKPRIIGYGSASFDARAVQNGVIKDPEIIARAMLNLFKHHLVGDITTHRCAMAIPSYQSYSRSVQLPRLKPNERDEAVRLEMEQYVPLPIDELYIDHTITSQPTEAGQVDEVFAVAIPKKIVDSYLTLSKVLGLETILIEPTMAAAARLFSRDAHSDIASVVVDFGSLSSDVSIFDHNVLVTGTVPAGGLVFTRSIAKRLDISEAQAATIKTRYGLAVSKKQREITMALEPTMTRLAQEIRRMVRYYEERYGTSHPISQVIALGGGANMPGLSDYLTNELRLPVRSYDPWNYLDKRHLQIPSLADHPMFATVAGLSLADPREVWRS